jgi:plastocyanin
MNAALLSLLGIALLEISSLGAIVTTRLDVGDQDAPKKAPVVTGRVLFDGERPPPKALPATAEQQKGCCPDAKPVNVIDPSLVIDDKNGLANVLVTVEVPGAKIEVPKTPFVLDQHACVFEPHCLIVPAGAKVIFKNSDTIAHNVHVYSARNDGSNEAIAPGAQTEVVYERADKIKIGCDYHPWMSSMLFVVDTPYCALTKPDGTFEIKGLPPGTWKVKLWHEVLGRVEAQVVVKEDGTAAPLEVKMAPRKKKD